MFTVDQIKSLNELELSVYQYVTQHPSAVPYMRIRELAAEAHVSTTTVLRFCKKIGCDGYAEFKLRMKQDLGQKNTSPVPDDLEELRTALERMKSAPFQERLEEAASLIARADRVLCVGVCNSGYIAEHAARFFTCFGKFTLAITDPYYPVGQLDDKLNTVAVIFSVSGEATKPVRLAQDLKRHGGHLICISNTDQNTIARMSDVALPYFITHRRIPGEDEQDIDFTSQVPAAAVAESLAKRLSSRLTEE